MPLGDRSDARHCHGRDRRAHRDAARGGRQLHLARDDPVWHRCSDIGAIYGGPFTNSGFTGSVYDRTRPGEYDLRVAAQRTINGAWDVARAAVRVTSSGLALNTPADAARVNWTFAVNGWALNPASVSGTGVTSVVVNAYVDGTNTLAQSVTAVYGMSRPDVGSAYGSSQFDTCGFSATLTLQPGVYRRRGATSRPTNTCRDREGAPRVSHADGASRRSGERVRV